VLGAGCWVLGAGCWVLGAGCWVLVRFFFAVTPEEQSERGQWPSPKYHRLNEQSE